MQNNQKMGHYRLNILCIFVSKFFYHDEIIG